MLLFDKSTLREIKGEIVDIQRHEGKTEVIVDSTSPTPAYYLTEEFIEFGDALDDKKFGHCVNILERLDSSGDVQAMWSHLLHFSLQDKNLNIVERCAVALKQNSLALFIRNLSNTSEWKIKAKVSELNRDIGGAERIYLSYKRPKEAALMYESLEMFSEAIRVMAHSKDPELDEKIDQYVYRLVETERSEKKAELMESEGNHSEAITVYMSAGLPEKAANVCLCKNITKPRELLEGIASALDSVGSYNVGGNLHAHMSNHKESISSFVAGGLFPKAVTIAKNHSTPAEMKE